MKNIFFAMCLVLLGTGAMAQVQFNPQIGMNFMSFSNPPAGTDYKANVGYSIGADLRFGERFQIQPGVHWFHSSTATENSDGSIETDDVVQQYLKVKAMAAYNLVDNGEFKFRINAGPAYDFLVNVDNDFLKKEDFNSGVFYLQGGVGIDILFLTAEVGYMQGMTNSFDFENAPDSKNQGFYFTVGLVFGNGK